MKKLAYFSLFLCFFVILASCGDNPVAPISDNETKIFNPKTVNCITPEYQPQSVPIDCYESGQIEWSGDDNNFSKRAIQGWMQSVPLNPLDSANQDDYVEVDYMVLMEIDRHTKKESIVDSLNFRGQTRKLTINEGGLYLRWYTDPYPTNMTNAEISDGLLKILPSAVPNRVSHWWMNSKGKYERKLGKDYYMIVRLRVTGNVGVQIGADYYPTVSSGSIDIQEAFHSNWIGATNGFVEYCFPNRKE